MLHPSFHEHLSVDLYTLFLEPSLSLQPPQSGRRNVPEGPSGIESRYRVGKGGPFFILLEVADGRDNKRQRVGRVGVLCFAPFFLSNQGESRCGENGSNLNPLRHIRVVANKGGIFVPSPLELRAASCELAGSVCRQHEEKRLSG